MGTTKKLPPQLAAALRVHYAPMASMADRRKAWNTMERYGHKPAPEVKVHRRDSFAGGGARVQLVRWAPGEVAKHGRVEYASALKRSLHDARKLCDAFLSRHPEFVVLDGEHVAGPPFGAEPDARQTGESERDHRARMQYAAAQVAQTRAQAAARIANDTVIGARVALVEALDGGKVDTLDLSVVHALGLARALEIAHEAGVFRGRKDQREAEQLAAKARKSKAHPADEIASPLEKEEALTELLDLLEDAITTGGIESISISGAARVRELVKAVRS